MNNQSILNIISFSIIFLYIIPIVLFVYSKNVFHLKALVGLGLTGWLSESLKHHIIKDASPRPKGAQDCNLLCNDGNQEGQPGMPSSHSAQVAFFTGMYYFQTTNPFIRAFLVCYELLVMLSRYLKRCHTIQQIGVGTLFGLILSLIFR